MQARLTIVTLGISDMQTSVSFYEALGFTRKMKATGDAIAFFDARGPVLALFPWDSLAEDAELPAAPRPAAFRGATLAWNCDSPREVDAVFAHAIACGAKVLKQPQQTFYGGYSGYFADPDGHPWEVVTAPGVTVTADGRLLLPD
jgi:uncharacterized protein